VPRAGEPHAVDERLPDRSQQAVLGSLDGEGIAEITTFLGPELLPRFGLADEVCR
jgi:hypothetical protein